MNKTKNIVKRFTRIRKASFYAMYGIVIKGNKILAPWGEFIPQPLTMGSKTCTLGFSTLGGSREWEFEFQGELVKMCGTCTHQCPNCYACGGNYVRYMSVKTSNGIRTILARKYLDFLKRAILAQVAWGSGWEVRSDGSFGRIPVDKVRVHVSGDFFSKEYTDMWHEVATSCFRTSFWAYTKEEEAEKAFDDIPNFNIVGSIIDGYGINYGTIDHVLGAKEFLEAQGEETFICRCSIDKGQKCSNCGACRNLKHVLFLEHGNKEYNPEKDSRWEEFKGIVENQKNWNT